MKEEAMALTLCCVLASSCSNPASPPDATEPQTNIPVLAGSIWPPARMPSIRKDSPLLRKATAAFTNYYRGDYEMKPTCLFQGDLWFPDEMDVPIPRDVHTALVSIHDRYEQFAVVAHNETTNIWLLWGDGASGKALHVCGVIGPLHLDEFVGKFQPTDED